MKTKSQVLKSVESSIENSVMSSIDSTYHIVQRIKVEEFDGFYGVDVYLPIVSKRLLELLSDRFDIYITILPCDDISVRISFNIPKI